MKVSAEAETKFEIMKFMLSRSRIILRGGGVELSGKIYKIENLWMYFCYEFKVMELCLWYFYIYFLNTKCPPFYLLCCHKNECVTSLKIFF